jgi:putative holliday junction resolvase
MKISVLALDIGSKRVGVAGCDGLGLMAIGITTIERTSIPADFQAIEQIAIEREVTLLVVGMPYLADGSIGSQGKKIQKYANKLSKALNLPVEYVDERYTSFEAEQRMISSGRSPSRNKGEIDLHAAEIILQSWLESR